MYSVHSPMAFQMSDRHKVRTIFHMAHLSGKDVKATITKITKKINLSKIENINDLSQLVSSMLKITCTLNATE